MGYAVKSIKQQSKILFNFWTIAVGLMCIGLVLAFMATQNVQAINTVKTWPTSGSWSTETLASSTTNIVKNSDSITMTAPQPTPNFTQSVVATGLDTIWSMRFASDGRMFISERPGRVRVMQNGVLNPTPVLTIAGTETLSAEEGLQGLDLDPDFANNGYIYVYYTFTDSSGLMKNRVARYTVTANNTTTGSPLVLVDNIPGSRFHNGGRVAFGPDGKLYIATGAADVDAAAQDINSTAGKILRINSDGTIPADNPFPGNPTYSFGHRNPQGLAWHPVTGELWSTEHGPTGTAPFCCHDEVNVIVPGGNYGWPKYYGSLTNSTHAGLNVVNPIAPRYESGDGKWAPGSAMFYTGTEFDNSWKQSLLFAGLGISSGGRSVYRLNLASDNQTPTSIQQFLTSQYGRLRDMTQGPDGSIYVSTSNKDGRGTPIAEDDRIIKLTPDFGASSSASFVVNYDVGVNNLADWMSLSPTATAPAGTSIKYEIATSNDGINYSAYSTDFNAATTSRYAKVQVTLGSQKVGVVPVLNSFTLNYDLTNTPPPPAGYCETASFLLCQDFGQNSNGMTSTGGTWTVSGGAYRLTSPVNTTSVLNNRSVHSTSVSGDYSVSAKVMPVASTTTSNDVALIFAYQNSSNYWFVSLAENNATQNHGLFKVVNGTTSQVVDFSTTYMIKDGITYNLKLEKVGSTLKIYRDNVLITTTTQSTVPASGLVGVGSINDPSTFDELAVASIVAPPPPPPPASFCSGKTAFICEDFTSNASNFAANGGTWAVSNGLYRLTSPLNTNSNLNNKSINSKTITGDYTVSAKITPSASSSTSNDIALVFAYVDASNYWFVSLAENNATQNHGLFKVVNGTTSQVVDFSTTYMVKDSTTYDVKLVKTGTNLKVFRNGTQVISTTQTTPSTGKVGFGSINDPATFDELLVTQP